jgi:hypothetical protein
VSDPRAIVIRYCRYCTVILECKLPCRIVEKGWNGQQMTAIRKSY